MACIIWNDEPGENVDHIAEHGLLPEDVEYVLGNHEARAESRSSDRPCVFGYTEDGRYIIVVYDQIDEETIYPVTAFEVPEP
jgi:uncharacterized DUF497 family protein